MLEKENLTIIAGPCAVETRPRINEIAKLSQLEEVQFLRGCAFKPRTSHPKTGEFFEGAGQSGVSMLIDAGIKHHIPVATEVIIPEHVTMIVDELNKRQEAIPLLLWIGSRNQNHYIQTAIARLIKQYLPEETLLLIKNQPWSSEKHWKGIASHVINGTQFPEDNILLCHRGFEPNGLENPHGFRNLPDFEMAMKVKESNGLPMILDPSHIGGNVPNVLKIIQMAKSFNFDGLMIEVHPDPPNAWTDAKQQLNPDQFKQLCQQL